jgi:hypothetical protein
MRQPLLCSRHHHTVHKPGWATKLHPDGIYDVTNPQGTTRSSRPPGTAARE